jgi:hypothetical protein
MMKVGFRFAALAVALAAVSCGTAQATLLWYDGFDTSADYTVDTNLGTQSGGAGSFFTGAWEQAGGDNHHVLAASLTRPGQINPSIGGKAGDDNNTGGCCNTARTGRLLTDPFGGFTDPDGTFYFGFLANFGTGPTKHHRVLEAWNGSLGDGDRILQLGYSEFTGVGPKMSLWVNDGGGAGSQQVQLSERVDFALDNGTTHFIVLKFEMSTSGPDVISAFLDPVGTTEPGTPSAQITTNEFFMDRFGAITNFVFGDASPAEFDELRVADNTDGMGFAQVANNTFAYVPEPASLSLLGLAAMGLLVSGRKRS